MWLWTRQNKNIGFAIALKLHIAIILLMLSASSVSASSTSSTVNPSSYVSHSLHSVQLASTPLPQEGSNIIIPNKVNFTTSEVSMLYPAGWNGVRGDFETEGVNSIITFRAGADNDTDDTLAILNVAVHDLLGTAAGISTEEYANGQLLFLRGTIPDFEPIQFNKTTVSGRPAYQILYRGLQGLQEAATMKVWVVDNQSSFGGSAAYTITYSAKPENYFSNLESARNMIDSLIIRERVGRAPTEAFLIAELLGHLPEASRERLLDIASVGVLKSIVGGDLNSFNNFIEGSTNKLPSNFMRIDAPNLNEDIAVHYHLTSAYLNATTDSVYSALALLFTDNNSNRILLEPVDYRVTINASNNNNFNFEEHGSTSIGFDILFLNGTSFEEALRSNNQQYVLRMDDLS